MAFEYFASKEVFPGVYQITNGIFDDSLPTFCYLVLGRDCAMLVDSMYGVGSLKKYCASLTDLPIIHVCTHSHGDHTGGSYEFDDVYISPLDFETFWNRMPKDRENAMNTARRRTLAEYQDGLDIEDMVEPRTVRLHPLFDGDFIDLGDRKIEVIGVGGHTAGEIVLLDREKKCLYSGDACNRYTLLQLDGRVSVRQYRENLIHLNTFRSEFDTLCNGHDIQPDYIIDEGIELCDRIIAGTDDKVENVSRGAVSYLAAKQAEGSVFREDGKLFNCIYRREWVDEPGIRENTIKI